MVEELVQTRRSLRGKAKVLLGDSCLDIGPDCGEGPAQGQMGLGRAELLLLLCGKLVEMRQDIVE